MNAQAQLAAFSAAFARTREGAMNAQAFSAMAREQDVLLSALPGKYSDVLLQLLDRLESSALFTEESCSFSQNDLLDSLQMWLDKARGQLEMK
jgi:hypothetical protein